jgi:hypothetical protein
MMNRDQAGRVVDLLFLGLAGAVERSKGYADKGGLMYWRPIYEEFQRDRKAFVRDLANVWGKEGS